MACITVKTGFLAKRRIAVQAPVVIYRYGYQLDVAENGEGAA